MICVLELNTTQEVLNMKTDTERILDIVIKLDSQVRKLKDRIKVLEEKEADLFTKYYNRGQIDAGNSFLDDRIKALEAKIKRNFLNRYNDKLEFINNRIKALEAKDLDITKGYFRAFEKDVSAGHLSNKKAIRELKDIVKDMEVQ